MKTHAHTQFWFVMFGVSKILTHNYCCWKKTIYKGRCGFGGGSHLYFAHMKMDGFGRGAAISRVVGRGVEKVEALHLLRLVLNPEIVGGLSGWIAALGEAPSSGLEQITFLHEPG